MKKSALIIALGIVLCATGASIAALLGIAPGFPVATYDSNGITDYDASSDAFSILASPISIRFSAITPPRVVSPTGIPPVEVVQVGASISDTGAVLSGVAGDDFIVTGQVDQNGDSIIDYAGVLLTGEIMEFGFAEEGATDRFDFRFSATGGALASFYTGKDIGMTVTVEHSSFTGDFTLNFNGGAKGSIGPIDKRNRPPFCEANGPYVAECAGTSTSIVLDGSQSGDDDGDAITYSWTTDCPSSSFDDPTSATPTLTIDTAPGCNVQCSVTLVVSDGISPSETCTAQVTISDTNNPELVCPNNLTVQCNTPTDPATTGTATGSDLCDPSVDVTYNDVETPGECAQEKTITRTWTATDDCSNSVSCDQIITVEDTTAPIITQCPLDKQVTCAQGTSPDVTGRPVAIDNCDGAPTATFSDDIDPGCCPIAIVITRTWTVSDACGNTATCVQRINVRDTSVPVITCPPDKTIQCNESKHPSNTGYATATDSCDPNPTVSYYDDVCGTCPKIIRRTWKAKDDCGNYVRCTQTITVVDTTAPVICCPPNVTVACGASTDPCRTGQATATDNCDSCVYITYYDTDNGCGCGRTITRKWKAKDDCGNTSYCYQTITVSAANVCPHSPGYWKNHRSDWPVNSLTVGDEHYNATELMNLLKGRLPNGCDAGSDASAALAKFVIAAKFSILDGASPQNIQPVINAADDFLERWPPGSNPRGSNRACANNLKDDLDEYVNSNPNGCHD